MIKNLPYLLLLGSTLLFSSCKKEEVAPVKDDVIVPVLDKEIRIVFPEISSTPSKEFYFQPSRDFYLIKFNKANYNNLKSIILYASFTIGQWSEDVVTLNLYNVTDNVPINNTTLEATISKGDLSYLLAETGNIINDLPDKEIDLAIRLAKG